MPARTSAYSSASVGSAGRSTRAAASFDHYADFEARGEAFRDLVAALPGARDEDVLPGVPRPGGRLQ